MTRKHVGMFNDEQYEVLVGVLDTHTLRGGSRRWTKGWAIRWLWDYGWERGVSKRSTVSFVMRPLYEMGVYINDGDERRRVIAMWRLKVGR